MDELRVLDQTPNHAQAIPPYPQPPPASLSGDQNFSLDYQNPIDGLFHKTSNLSFDRASQPNLQMNERDPQ